MCGIAGILSKEKARFPKEWLLSMAPELRFRGQDSVGLYLDHGVGLVTTRLSIIDLSGGDQPIGHEDGRFWAVQTGEVYNHIELRAEPESLRHRFATHSDAEVIVQAFDVSEPQRGKSEPELAEELAWLLTDAIRLRPRADVPVGAYLSGGLDSPTIVGMAREEAPDRLR